MKSNQKIIFGIALLGIFFCQSTRELNASAAEHNQDQPKVVAKRLIIMPLRHFFVNAVKESESLNEKKERVGQALATVIAGQMNLPIQIAQTKIDDFESVKSIFSSRILNQKEDSPIYKLLKIDTQIFFALPDPIQKKLLENRRLEFTYEPRNINTVEIDIKSLGEPGGHNRGPAPIIDESQRDDKYGREEGKRALDEIAIIPQEQRPKAKPRVKEMPSKEIRLIKSEFRNRFHKEMQGSKTAAEDRTNVAQILTEIAAKKLKVSPPKIYKQIYELENIKELFNNLILNQKPSDPTYVLSKHDTRIFYALPQEIQQQILKDRRIKLAY